MTANDPTPLGTELRETLRLRRGHDFYPPAIERAAIPALYATESEPLANKTIWLHYFIGGMDWYIAEVDWSTGIAFGYAALGLGGDEWGDIWLPELEAVAAGPLQQPVERDLDWTPKPFSEVNR